MPAGLTAWNIITLLILIIGFIANAAYLKGTFTVRIQDNTNEIDMLRKTVRYASECKPMYGGHETRIASLEKVRNSGGG